MNLPALAVRRPAATLVLTLAVAVVGVLALLRLPTNLLPDITYPLVKVYVGWRGATPEEIENEIATVVERRMATVDGLDYLESQTTEGLYTLLVNFDYSTDRDVAYQDVLAKMGLVRQRLPAYADEPQIIKADPSQLPVVDLLVTSETLDLVRLRTWVENELQDQFVTVPGTAGTEIVGGLVREIRVELDPALLQGYGLTVDGVLRRLRDENLELAGGRVTSARREFVARTMGEFRSVADIGRLPVAAGPGGTTLRLGDIATVSDASALQRIRTRVGGREGVKLSIFKQAGANTVEVSDGIRARLAELNARANAPARMEVIYDQAEYIRAAVTGVRDAALIAALLVVLATAFFLAGWRRVLVVAATLPVTLLGTFFLMEALGFSINILSLGGLVVAITVLLDNCVVVLENITRLQEEGTDPAPVRTGAAGVAGAVFAATATFLALFLPFLLVPGLTSLLFRELILTVAIAIALSLVVSLTLTPSLTALLYPEGRRVSPGRGLVARLEARTLAWLAAAYRPLLRLALRLRWAVMAAVLGLFVVGVVLLRGLGSEFLPPADDGLVTVKVKLPTGVALDRTEAAVRAVEQAVERVPYIERYSSLVGGKVWGLVTSEVPNEGEVDLQLVRPRLRPMDTEAFVRAFGPEIRRAGQPLGVGVKVMHTKMKGIRSIGEFDIEAEVLAPRSAAMTEIRQQADAVAQELRRIPGLTNVDVSIDVSKPEYQIFVDRERAAALGLSIRDVAGTVRALVDGAVSGSYREAGFTYPIRVLVKEARFRGREDLAAIPLFGPRGGVVYLRDVAQVAERVGPVEIDRKDQARSIKATASVAGRTVGEATADVQAALAHLTLPPGYSVHLGGQSQVLAENLHVMVLILSLALFFGYVVLVVSFGDFVRPLMILVRVPLSLVGVSLALWITGHPVGVTVLIGFIVLAGIEVNQGVLLVTFIDQLRAEGLELREAIERAAMARLRPILMTDLVGIAGLLPLALGLGEGTELLRPMAIGVIGGLVMGLGLVFLFVPPLYVLAVGGRAVASEALPRRSS